MIAGYKLINPYTKQPTGFVEKIENGTKIHTVRRGDRWSKAFKNAKKRGEMLYIQHCTGVRTANYKEHLSHEVVSTQRVFMTYNGWALEATIGNKYHYIQDKGLWLNDGFDTIDDFRNWFADDIEKNGDFIGEIIHWTDLKY